MQCSSRHVNEIPEWTEVRGDARLTPFHSVQACTRKLQEYVAAFNEGLLSGVGLNLQLNYVLFQIHVAKCMVVLTHVDV